MSKQAAPLSVKAVTDRLAQRVLNEAGSNDPGGAVQQAINNGVKANIATLEDIPRELLVLMLAMIADEESYKDCIVLYGGLSQISKAVAVLMEDAAIWRALLLAYVRRSRPLKGIDVSDINDYMQTLFDHYKHAVNQRSTRPELVEVWRTWKRILEHFKRIDDRITEGATPISKLLPLAAEKTSVSDVPAMISCPESPYTFIVRTERMFTGRILVVSGLGSVQKWLQKSPDTSAPTHYELDGSIPEDKTYVSIPDYTSWSAVKAVAHREHRGRNAYINLLTLGQESIFPKVKRKLYVHRIELPNEKNTQGEMELHFEMHSQTVHLSSILGKVINVAVSRKFLWVVGTLKENYLVSRDYRTSRINFVYSYDIDAREYSQEPVAVFETPSRDHGQTSMGFVVHPFRSNTFIQCRRDGINILMLDANGKLKREITMESHPDTRRDNAEVVVRKPEIQQTDGETFVVSNIVHRMRAYISAPPSFPIIRYDVDNAIEYAIENDHLALGAGPLVWSHYIPIAQTYNGEPCETRVDSRWLLVAGLAWSDKPYGPRLQPRSVRLRFFDLEAAGDALDLPLDGVENQVPTSSLELTYEDVNRAPKIHFHNGTIVIVRETGMFAVSYGFDEWSSDASNYLSSQPLSKYE